MRQIPTVLLTMLLLTAPQGATQRQPQPPSLPNTVLRGDTGEPLAGVRIGPKALEIPNAFDKPCKAQTVTDVSEGSSVVTDQNGKFTLESTPSLPPGPPPTRRVPAPEDETVRRILELERMRVLADNGVQVISQDRVDRQRVPQETLDAITVPNTVPLALRSGVPSDLVAQREGFVSAPWNNFVLLPAPTLSGRIVDASNKPVAGAVVQVYEVRFRPLGRTMKWVKSTLTNDLGDYRLPWLPYGWYTIAAGYSNYVQQPWMESLKLSPNLPEPDAGLPLLFYPGVENAADAELIHIKPPSESNAALPATIANLALKERPRFNIKVRLAAERVPANANLVVVPAGGDVCASMDYAIKGNSDGTFDVRNIPRGRYEMVAILGRDVISALMPVKIEKDDDLKLPVTPPVTLRGTITFEDLPPGTDINVLLGELRVSLTRARSEVSQVAASVANSRSFNFAIPGLGPGFYYPTLNLPPGAFIKDIHVMGVERTAANQEGWRCNASPTGPYSYLDGHGHLEPLELPKAIFTGDPNALLCLKIDVSFSGQMEGMAYTWTANCPGGPLQCSVPRPLNPGMVVLMPRSVWGKSDDNGVTPPDRILIIDGSGGHFQFSGVPHGDYQMYAVEYPNAELIYRREFTEWFGASALPLLYDFVSPCPPPGTRCEVYAPAQSTVDRLVP